MENRLMWSKNALTVNSVAVADVVMLENKHHNDNEDALKVSERRLRRLYY